MTIDRDGMALDTAPGQAAYSWWSLALYDAFVLGLSCRFAWRCPSERLLAHYTRHVSPRHLDVGVGTGYFLDRCRFPANVPRIWLFDLNPRSLAHAAERIARYAPRTLQGDVMQPLRVAERFDSIGLGFLLHCLPGGMSDKAAAIANLARVLAPEGVLFGSTILGRGVEHNAFGRRLMALYNAKGIFANADDSESGLRDALSAAFEDVAIERVGTVALFSSRRSKLG